MMHLPWWLSLMNGALCLLWSGLAMLLVRFAVQWAHASWLRMRDLFGVGGSRTLALVCAAVLFMGSVPRFIEVPLRLVYATVLAVPVQALVDPPEPGDVPTAPLDAAQVVGRTGRRLVDGLVGELEHFQRDLPYEQLVFFLIVWFMTAQAFKHVLPSKEGLHGEEGGALKQLLQGRRLMSWVLVFLLVVGLSLCVASITAVSELHDKSNPDNMPPPKEELETRLTASKDRFLDDAYPYKDLPEDAVALLEAQLQEAHKALPLAQERLALLADIQAQLGFVQGSRQQLRGTWENLLHLTQGRYERATQDAVTEYEVSLSTPHGVREQRQQFLDIVAWHRDTRYMLRTVVEKCRLEIVTTETSWLAWASSMRSKVGGGTPQSTTMDALRKQLLRAQEKCQAERPQRVPLRSDFGAALGPLKPISGWLLNTESVQLALIIGMLGAGLLGSAVASFMRTQGGRGQQTEEQLAGVVVRGVTAAIVVFLAVQGGLATVASTNSPTPPNPNPYLLLLICFVAAVYSEQVWNAAHQRLVKQLGSGGASPEASRSEPAGERAPQPVVEGVAVRRGGEVG